MLVSTFSSRKLGVGVISNTISNHLPTAERASQPRGRILLVEDDRFLHRVLREQLWAAGFEVTATDNAATFLTAIVETGARFDAAIVDLSLPGLDGDVAITWLRESEETLLRELPIIVLTGNPNLVEPWLSALPNVRHILFKPSPMEELLACVEDCLG